MTLLLSLLLGGWGSSGHRIINEKSALSFNQEMQDFNTWAQFLADHASDADYRKDQDPNEGPKHYIDIDLYYSFLFYGRIPQTIDSVIDMYGSGFVYDNGILPFATMATVEFLEQCFENHDFETAKSVAADLGHYVADGHQPLHITSNYDGQNTGNTGIHSRYETAMINVYSDEIQYDGLPVNYIENVTDYVFDYIYHNHTYVDSIIDADDYAKIVAGNTYSSEYKEVLWNQTRNLTMQLMRNASHRLTELIYTAWKNAGSPSLTADRKSVV